MPPHRARLRVFVHGIQGCSRKIRMEYCVAVKKEDEFFCCAPPSCIAADGRRRPLGMNNDHLGAVLGGKFRTAVSGVRIHVNELDPVKAACGADGLQASRQALTFIASNYDNGEGL